MNYIPQQLQEQIDRVYVEVDRECTIREDYNECYKLIEEGQKKINELLNNQNK